MGGKQSVMSRGGTLASRHCVPARWSNCKSSFPDSTEYFGGGVWNEAGTEQYMDDVIAHHPWVM